MRIRRLEIEQYGIFTGHAIEFPGDTLQLVFGPNEAGKSTLLQLVRELLFGFAVRNPYAFAEHTGEMAAVATLEMASGTQLRFRRRKGRRDEVVGEYLDGQRTIDAAALSRLLGGANSELFRNVFGFSLAELAAGQQSLEDARLSEALYGGALGGLAGFRQVLHGLEKEHESLFTATAIKKPINQLISELRKQGKQLRASQVRPRQYEQLAEEVRELHERADHLRRDRETLQRRQMRCAQLSQAVGLWRQRTVLLDELARFDVPRGFPRDGEHQFERYLAARDQLAGELEDFQQELREVQTQLETLSPQADLIDKAGQIQQLAQQLDKIRDFRRDIVLRRQESQAVKSTVLARLRDLDPSWTLEHLQRFQTSIARRASITAMQEELDELQQRQRDLLAQRPTLETDIADMQRHLETLQDDEVAASLIDLVESARQYELRLEKREQFQQQLREEIARSEALQQKLVAPLAAQLENLPQLSVPLMATVVEYRQQRDELHQQLEHCLLRLERSRTELDERRQELDALLAADQIPGQEQLNEVRTRRDRGWDLVRRRYIEDDSVSRGDLEDWTGDPSTSLPDGYEASVRDADHVADQRQQRAEVVAHLDQLARDIAKYQRFCEQEQQAHASCVAANDAWRQKWRDLWRPSGVEPQGPEAMLDWLRLHGDLVDTVARIDALRGHVDGERQWVEAYEAGLSAALSDIPKSPAAQIAEMRRRVQQSRDNATERKSYTAQLPRKQHQFATLKQELSDLAERREQWQARWQPLMGEFGFPTSWDVYTATTVLDVLSEASSQQKEAESLDCRVHDMEEGIDQFEREVNQLCTAVARPLKEQPAENGVEELVQMLDQTRQQLRDQRALTQQSAKLESRCELKRKQLDKEQEGLSRLLELAGTEREEELPELARRVRRWFETRDQLEKIGHQLRAIQGSEDPTQFETALNDVDEAEMESQQRILESELDRVDQLFNEALQAQGVASQQKQELDRTSHAIALAQDIEGTRGQLAEMVDRWAPLVLARAFMVQAMEQFQREHQPSLLVDIGRLMRRMTVGRYTGISRMLDERGSLQVHQADGTVKEPRQLSTGTREQLYLAIRLAYVMHYCRETESLPVVMDDVLVNFDDRCAAETLESLIDVSEHVQVILLTCHRNTVDLVRTRLPQLEPILLGENPS